MQTMTRNIDTNKSTAISSKLKKLSPDQTRKYLSDALNGKDVNIFSSVNIDQREAAKFIERQARILRFVSISARLPVITLLVEEIFYTAFEQVPTKSEKCRDELLLNNS